MAIRSPFVLVCLLIGALCGSLAHAAEVRGVRLWAGPDYTRAVLDVSGPVNYKLFTLQGPDRVVLDVKGGRAVSRLSSGIEGKGLLKSLRTGRQGRDLRIVLDLENAVRAKSFMLSPAENMGHRLVIDLYPAERAPSRERTVAQAVQGKNRDVVVAIDAGHGGEDPGAIGPSGVREKDVVLQIARALAKKIDAEPGMKAHLIRSGDYFLALRQRFSRARDAKADLFVSIHADAFHVRSVRGSSVYILSQRGASSEAARWIAERENRSDLVGGVSLDDKEDMLAAVLLDLSQGATLEASHAAAQHMLSSLAQVGQTHKRYVDRAGFAVLRSPDVPSVLIETAFISNPDEEKRLRNPKEQAKIADAVFKGVRSYFHASPPPGTWIASNVDRPRRHIVARGETLGEIANRHGISLTQLRTANALRSDMVQAGAVLTIPLGP